MTTKAADQALAIRAATRQHLAEIGKRLAAIKEEDDAQWVPEVRAKRVEERALLIRQWDAVEQTGLDGMGEWSDEALTQAAHLRAEHEIEVSARRGAANAEIADIALPYIGAPQRARTHLIPQARKFLALDMPDHADKILIAARRAGADDAYLERDIQAAWDRTVPTRIEATEIEDAVLQQRNLYDLDRYTLRLAHRVGDQVRASNVAKLAAAREGLPTPAGIYNAAPEGDKAPVG